MCFFLYHDEQIFFVFFFFQAEDGIRDLYVTGVQTCALPISNLFMHYAFDAWMQRECPRIWFERYCDDVVIHCASLKQAEYVQDRIVRRLKECGLEVHQDKTRIVYCRDGRRQGSHEHERFTYLGYEFRARG